MMKELSKIVQINNYLWIACQSEKSPNKDDKNLSGIDSLNTPHLNHGKTDSADAEDKMKLRKQEVVDHWFSDGPESLGDENSTHDDPCEPIFAKNPNFGVENSSSTGSSSNDPILAIQTDENSGLEAAIGAAPNIVLKVKVKINI